MTTAGGPEAAQFPAFGTTATVACAAPGALGAAVAAVRAAVDAVDRACSRFRPDSELSALNRRAGGPPVPVGPVLLEAVRVALAAAADTAGLVDPTVGAALVALGYDRDFALVAPAGPPLESAARPAGGWRRVVVDARSATVALPPGVQIDLGATAKAWCADRAAAMAARAAGAGVLVGLGGDLAAAGPRPEGGWVVRVADVHDAPADAPGQRISLTAGGLATSGTSARRWVRGGRLLHHVVDPATGLPTDGGWRTVTVAAPTCLEANVATTAALVLGAGAPAWLAGRGRAARLVAADGTVTGVGGWPSPSAPRRAA